MEYNKELFLFLFSFLSGFLSYSLFMWTGFLSPKVSSFCSPDDQLIFDATKDDASGSLTGELSQQYREEFKEWKVNAIPKSGGSANYYQLKPEERAMRDFKFNECLQHNYSIINYNGLISVEIDSSDNNLINCINGFEFEYPGRNVSFVSDVSLFFFIVFYVYFYP